MDDIDDFLEVTLYRRHDISCSDFFDGDIQGLLRSLSQAIKLLPCALDRVLLHIQKVFDELNELNLLLSITSIASPILRGF